MMALKNTLAKTEPTRKIIRGCGIHMARSLVAPQGIKDWLDYRTFNEVNEMISVVSRSPEDALRRFG